MLFDISSYMHTFSQIVLSNISKCQYITNESAKCISIMSKMIIYWQVLSNSINIVYLSHYIFQYMSIFARSVKVPFIVINPKTHIEH